MSASYKCDRCKEPAVYGWEPHLPYMKWELERTQPAVPQAVRDMQVEDRMPDHLDLCGGCKVKAEALVRGFVGGTN